MSQVYLWMHAIARCWILLASLLVIATFVFTFSGWNTQSTKCGCENFADDTVGTIAYQTVKLFTLDSELSDKNCVWQLEIARWLGAIVWSLAVSTVLVGLFKQRALTALVAGCTFWRRGHVIVAGLGRPEANSERLIGRLRAAGRDVVVLESDADHPGLDACRAAGAVCLHGSPQEETELRRAQIGRAGALLSLGDDDHRNIHLLGAAARLLGAPSGDSSHNGGAVVDGDEDPLAPADEGSVGCVIQLSEPGMLEVLGRHELQRDATDRLHLRVFNRHELVARAMLRESLLGRNAPSLRKVLLLGTGSQGRLGEALVLRAAKDLWIERTGETLSPLEIHVFEREAAQWIECLKARHEILDDTCGLVARDCLATKCGFRSVGGWQGIEQQNFDAAFVCLPDESHALLQASRLRDALPSHVPVVVRVQEEWAGFGELLRRPEAGGLGRNLRVVGTHDRVFDIAASLHPFAEIIAQALHQDYLYLTQRKIREAEARDDQKQAGELAKKAAFRPWSELDESYRESNRALALRLRRHLTVPQPDGAPPRQFRLVFSPRELIDPRQLYRLSDQETNNELERMAEQEHQLWCDAQRAAGWRYGAAGEHGSDPNQKLNPNLIPWKDISDGMKEYDRGIIRRLPYVFAKADYKVVEVQSANDVQSAQ